LKLPFSVIPTPPDKAFPNRSAVSRPIVGLLLQHNGKQMIVFALVDSGSDSSIFPSSIAESLGIPITNSKSSSFSGSKNEAQMAYFEEVQATILPMDGPNIDPNQEPLTFPLYAGFCDTLEHVGMGLLGQEGFFSRFTVHFNNAESYFEIL
jgi:hypothetical protein